MTKTTFLEALRRALAGLPQAEIDEAVAYYAGYIDDAGEENQQQVLEELGDPAAIAAQIRGEQNAAGNANSAPSGISLGARIPLAFVHVMISIPILGSLILTISCLVAAGGCMLIAGILGCILLLLFGFAAHAATAVMWIGGSLIIAAVGVLLGLSCIYLTKWLCQVLIRSTNYVFGREAK